MRKIDCLAGNEYKALYNKIQEYYKGGQIKWSRLCYNFRSYGR